MGDFYLSYGKNECRYRTENEKKKRESFSRMMAVILGFNRYLEVMIAGGMIFNIDFHSADIIAVIMGFIVLYSGDCVAVLTDN